MIFKALTSSNNSYSEPTSYVDTSVVDIKNSVDFVVDGNVYILKKDGSIVKLSQGQIVDFTIKNMPSDSLLVTNIRHHQALILALDALVRVEEGILMNISTDLLTQDIRESLFHLGEIVGEINSEEILGNIFSKFCIGK